MSLFLAGLLELHNVLIWGEKKRKHVHRTYVTLFGGSFRTAQRTEKKACAFFCIWRLHIFFVAGFSQRTAEGGQRTAEGGRYARFFCLFCQNAHKKKLHMIVREFEFVVVLFSNVLMALEHFLLDAKEIISFVAVRSFSWSSLVKEWVTRSLRSLVTSLFDLFASFIAPYSDSWNNFVSVSQIIL